MRNLALIALLGALNTPVHASSYTTDCGHPNVDLTATTSVDLDYACEGIERAFVYFASIGYDLSQYPMDIGIVDHQPNEPDVPSNGDILGEFNRLYEKGVDPNAIEIVSFDVFAAIQIENGYNPFGEPLTREFWVSTVTHEVAHLVLDATTDHNLKLSSVAHEYVAYAVQFLTMDPEVRDRLVSNYRVLPGQGTNGYVSNNGTQVLPTSPDLFGVLAYLSAAEDDTMLLAILANQYEVAPPREYTRRPRAEWPAFVVAWYENYQRSKDNGYNF